tara:strand:- start:1752 stop:2654 length:903 start_codon:yes stop_codon:yes gene_type:complete
MKSIGVFYNAEVRNNGTGRRVWDSLVRAGGKDAGCLRHNRPIHLPQDLDHDLLLFIDDGRDDIPMEVPSGTPSACWLVDTHLGWEQRLEWASHFDNVFTAQKEGAERMRDYGLPAMWLPLACHPSVDPCIAEMVEAREYTQYDAPDFDLAFVGFLNRGAGGDSKSHDRVEYLDHVMKAFPNSWLAFNKFFVDAAKIYHNARVGFNISIRDDLNMRFFETLSYGTALVTNTDVVGIDDLGFQEGIHYIGYKGLEEAVERIQWALDNPMERLSIARAGHTLARSSHTYKDRIDTLLEVCLGG